MSDKSDLKSMKWKLMTIKGVDEVLADKIVASGLTMADLSPLWQPISLAFCIDERTAKVISAAAIRFARTDGEVKDTSQIAKIRDSKPMAGNFIGVGLSQNRVDILLAAIPSLYGLAMERAEDLVQIFDFSAEDAVTAIALARMICHWEMDSADLQRFLEESHGLAKKKNQD